MHRPLALLVLVVTSACHRAPAPAAAANGALTIVNPVGDRPTYFDFGRVAYGRKAEHVFRVRNDEDGAVMVKDLLPSCGCASAKISVPGSGSVAVQGDPGNHEALIRIPAGATADLTVSIDTEHVQVINQDKLAQVRMRSDSKTAPYLTFEVHLTAERAMRAVPAEIELGQTPQSVGKSGRADVSADLRGSRVRVLGVESVEGPFTATADETDVGGVPVWVVVANANPGQPPGPVSGKVILSVRGEDGTGKGLPFQIPVRAQISEDVVAMPPVFLFGAFERAKGASKESQIVALVPGERVRVRETSFSNLPAGLATEITAEVTPIDPDADGRAEKWKIVLKASEKMPEGPFSGTLEVALDHPRVWAIRMAFSGTAR